MTDWKTLLKFFKELRDNAKLSEKLKLTAKKNKNLIKLLSNKEDFVNFYRQMNSLFLDKDVYKSIKFKEENDIKIILNNPRCINKKKYIKYTKQQSNNLIKEFKEIELFDWKKYGVKE
ncbi:MAG TPA: hypothetical protein VIR31_05860 [Nitrososphaeraceae archaeon]